MCFPRKTVAACLFWAALWFAPVLLHAQALPSVRRVQLLGSKGQVEIEIETSEHIVPQINLLTGPDRLVVDFVNARPGTQLRNLAVNREEVKNLRVGLFSSDPPVTRLVLDLNGPQPYQVFPSGRSVIVKIGSAGAHGAVASVPGGAVLVNAKYSAAATPVSSAKPRLEVLFHDGLLSISSNKANLSEVLFEIHQRTGAEIDIPAGAEQEEVMAQLGPAPAPEVLTHLLNGSRFNFMILSSPTDARALDRVILSPRSDRPATSPALQPMEDQAGYTQPVTGPTPRSVPPGPSANDPTLPPDDTAPGDAPN